MAPPRVIVAVICDDVRHEQGEKESLMGLFTTFRVSDYQQPLPRFAVFLKLGFDEPGAHTVGLNVRSHEGDFGINLEGPVEGLARDEAYGQYLVGMVLNLPDLKVPREGRYAVNVKVDGTEVVQIPFVVQTTKPPTVQ